MLKGITRALTLHEIARGYIYVSQDRKLKEILDTTEFTVRIGNTKLENKRIDVSGRVHVPRSLSE